MDIRSAIKLRHEELETAINESDLTQESKEMVLTILSDWLKQTD